MTRKFTKLEMAAMELLGWRFVQTGPNEFGWLKFDKNHKQVAAQCDKMWARDVESVEEAR